MIVGILIGVSAFMNYLVPLLIGASDMAFPRLNAFSFWIAVPAGIILLSSLALGGFDTGWTGYPPLSIRAPLGMQMFFLGVSLSSFSSILSALNILATVIRLRTKGMTPFRLPIFVWAAIATSIISLTATQLIGLAFQMVMLERLLGMGFFDPIKGGNPILFEHLFWFYSHPAVYVFVLPGLGIISELLPVFARKPLYGYKWVAMSSLGIALTGFLVWGHHMFAAGMAEYLREPFMYSTLLVAVPTGVKFFSWVATVWKGKISFPTPMLFVLGGIVVFLLGGLSGPPNATVSTDLLLNNTYYIVGHFHDTLFGGYVFPIFAALYYWWPKMTGRRLNEKLGKLHFWLMGPAMIVLTLMMMRIGLLGMRRRVADYDPALGFQPYHLVMTIAGFMVAVSVLVFFINVFLTNKRGERVTGNIWNSRSPEWQVPSPMPIHNYQRRRDVGQVGQEGSQRPPRQQNRQGPGPAQALRRRHPERTQESHRLAGTLGPRVPVRRPGQEDGADGHLHQSRGRRAALRGQRLKPNESVPSGRRGSASAAFLCPFPEQEPAVRSDWCCSESTGQSASAGFRESSRVRPTGFLVTSADCVSSQLTSQRCAQTTGPRKSLVGSRAETR